MRQATRDRNRQWYARLPFWRRAERAICQQLRENGVECTLVSTKGLPWDVETKNGLRIECKAANQITIKKGSRRQPTFVVAIVRPYGKRHRLKEEAIDFYVVRLLADWKTYLMESTMRYLKPSRDQAVQEKVNDIFA